MSNIQRIAPATQWTLATNGMTIPVGARGILIKGGGSITIVDNDGTSLAISATADTVFPLMPSAVTAASNAYILS